MDQKLKVGILGGTGTVSYTHLDVYKRQIQGYPCEGKD